MIVESELSGEFCMCQEWLPPHQIFQYMLLKRTRGGNSSIIRFNAVHSRGDECKYSASPPILYRPAPAVPFHEGANKLVANQVGKEFQAPQTTFSDQLFLTSCHTVRCKDNGFQWASEATARTERKFRALPA